MNEPPDQPSQPEDAAPATDPVSDPPESDEAAEQRRKAALRRFVEEHREWLEEMSQH